jgi:hypothetical protein
MPRSLKWSLCKQKFHAKLPCCIYPCNFPGTIVIIWERERERERERRGLF